MQVGIFFAACFTHSPFFYNGKPLDDYFFCDHKQPGLMVIRLKVYFCKAINKTLC